MSPPRMAMAGAGGRHSGNVVFESNLMGPSCVVIVVAHYIRREEVYFIFLVGEG